ncbi:MAG TPA: P-loop NTPase fold protein [Thermoleophilaceae bacterium]|jgi:hypothetical protein
MADEARPATAGAPDAAPSTSAASDAEWQDSFSAFTTVPDPDARVGALSEIVAEAPDHLFPRAAEIVTEAVLPASPRQGTSALVRLVAAFHERGHLPADVARAWAAALNDGDAAALDAAVPPTVIERAHPAVRESLETLRYASENQVELPDAAPPPDRPDALAADQFSNSAIDALGFASAILDHMPPTAKLDSTVLLAGFVLHAQPRRADTSVAVFNELSRQMGTGKRGIVYALAGEGVGVPRKPRPLPPRERVSTELLALLAAARGLALDAGDGEVTRVRHLLTVLLTRHGQRDPPAVHEVLARHDVDLPRLREVLLDAIRAARPEDDLELWADVLTRADAVLPRLQIAGYTSDTVGFEDQLDIEDDVNTLASVLASRTVEPPVSVGLFGDWGTGKTFFMTALERRLDAIQQAARAGGGETVYCRNIKHIRFNAWHYADANLWASLATEIFEGLAAPDDGIEAERARERLLQLETSRRALEEARRAHEGAVRRRDEIERRIDDLEATRLKRKRLAVLTLAEREIAPAGREQLDRVASEGATDSRMRSEPLHDLASDLAGITGAARTVGRIVGVRRMLMWSLAVLLVAALVFFGVQMLTGDAIATVTAVLAATSSAVTLLRPKVAVARGVAEAAAQAATAIQGEIQQAEAELIAARGERDRLETQLREARLTVEATAEEVEEIKLGKRLTRFIEARAQGDDYRKHLGLVSLIRRDFLELNRLMLEAPESGGSAGPPPLDRIVLYIDDLDRCGPDRVVQVLEAIHLLLALRLFVVVVAVDSRWLLRSLEIHYGALRKQEPDDDAEEDYWAATPQNYLEKIFQIPYAVRPMGRTGYKGLIKALLPAAEPDDAEPAEGRADRAQVEDLDQEQASGDLALEASPPRPVAPRADPRRGAEPDIDLAPETLMVTDAELQSMQMLAPLIRTPRAAKRLVNTYRLARASLADEELQTFVDQPDRPGEHRVALILLGILIGHPTKAEGFFERLLDPAQTPGPAPITWGQFVTAFGHDVPGSDRFVEGVREATVALDPPEVLAPYASWAARVGRYSFHTSRLVIPSA